MRWFFSREAIGWRWYYQLEIDVRFRLIKSYTQIKSFYLLLSSDIVSMFADKPIKKEVTMAHNHEKECPCCHALVGIVEAPMGVAGGKEREEALCPICHTELYSAMTDGWFYTSIISTQDIIEPYKSQHQNREV